jgi:hypothetical protein
MLKLIAVVVKPTFVKIQNRGNAVLEVLPVIILLMVLLRYSFGFFGVIHTGTLNSISARNYAFETFRHRTMLNYFRAKRANTFEIDLLKNNRYHSTVSEKRITTSPPQQWATTRSIMFPPVEVDNEKGGSQSYHNVKIMNDIRPGQRYDKDEGVDPVWIRTRYGICLNAGCGG